ncbi:disease resistance-like protein DSC1 [Ziziphus jujuba]|uniref:ADP-ribosyl cyclase/cyclic ADP-ribose hydrolase n=1 Tax=Ziziphus jujuba TaxID=326968 RepID=A0ABM3ZTL2_ZIZJJ|nr:disease resistance-like protein DSC1 [Ziziphus jujuba]
MDCKKRIGQIVVPVFYRIKPSHVRKQKGSIAAGLSKLGERFDEDKMSLWRAALTEAANLSGFDSKKIRPESELVEAIIKDVLKKLNYASSSDLKGLIGIEERIKKVESLLCINGSENVRIVGIWGMGGIGKTTLSDVVFNRLSSQFESCYFLSNVEEKAKKYVKPDYFQEKLLSVLLEDENSKKGLPSIRSTFVQERLRRKKVLVVLDDMKDNQIELLSRAHDLFGHGSRIIVTTRDVQVLRSIGADEIYEVEELYWDEAFKLFCQCAFRNDSPTSRDFIDLSKEMVRYTNGNPLALKVLGSFLCCRTKEQWQSALDELKTVPNKEIHNVLKMSYDGLNENQKEIFLDIACFFEDQDKDHVRNIQDGCGFSAEIGFQVLVDKSLITIVNKTVKMHNLLQEMGREIVRHKSIKEPEKHGRLWIAKDIYHVLKNGLGTKAIEGMFLDMSKGRDQLQLRSSSFKKLYNLRLLKVYNNYDLTYPEKCKVTLPKGLLSIPDALRYFHWEAYPLKSLPPRFSPYNLVELNMPHSQAEQLWDGIQELENLKHIDLSWSTQLTQIPNLSLAPNLEGVKLKGCICLNEVPSYFQDFDKLTSLNLRSCSNLKNLPEIPQSMERLDLSEIEIQELPSSIWSLHKLHTFHLDGYKYIKDIPSDASMLNSLNSLSLRNCTSFTEFHELPRNISKLNLSNTAIEVIPSSIQCLSSLVYLYLRDCKRLKSLPTSICKLKSLKTISLGGCSQLESFPKILEPMESLEDLCLDGTAIKRLHSSIDCLIELEYLSLSYCENIEFVPAGISHLSKLGYLSFAGCSKLERLPPLYCYWPFSLPLQLYLSDRDDFRSYSLLSLTTLDLSGTNIERVPKSIEEVFFLNVLVLSNCKRLKSLPKLPFVLQVLYADDCTSLETVASSRTELIRYWEDHLWNARKEEGLKFFNCLNLDQTAKRNIMADAELRIWRKAALAKEYFNKNASHVFEEPSVCVCYPGSEIPKWFMYQTAGPSVNIKLPLHWFNDNNFLGFAICIVANFDGDDDKDKDENMANSYLKCGIHFKTSCGESHRFDCFLKVWGDTRKVISDHVFQWYDYDLYDGVKSIWYTTSLNNEDITEVEF